MRILITGGCGFLGSNLTQFGLNAGHELFIVDNLSRTGSKENLDWLKGQGPISFFNADTFNKVDIDNILQHVKPEAVFHVAGQVAMTKSIEDPLNDLQTNLIGSFNVLNAVRNYAPDARLLFSSTNKVYGDLSSVEIIEKKTRFEPKHYSKGFSAEDLPLNFASPYGCSKGAADQYFLDFHKIYDLKTTVFRHSSMYGGRQFSTEDQGWVGWFIDQAMQVKNGTINKIKVAGTGKQVRDLLFSDDMCTLYYGALSSEKCIGKAYNVGGGVQNSKSIIELIEYLQEYIGIHLNLSLGEERISDQKYFVSDNSSILKDINWVPEVSADVGLQRMIHWVNRNSK